MLYFYKCFGILELVSRNFIKKDLGGFARAAQLREADVASSREPQFDEGQYRFTMIPLKP